MDIILVPGLWLDASSWEQVLPILREAGHRPVPLTLPGLESLAADRSRIHLTDHVEAVVEAIDEAEGPCVLVGHSMGAGIASIAVDARPHSVRHVMYVGGFPARDGQPLAPDFEVVDGEVPMPSFSDFEEADLADLDDAARADLRARAIPSPAGTVMDPARLGDERRYEVPATAICPEYTSDQLRSWLEEGEESVQEFGKIRDLRYVDIPTGHWPQLTRPVALGEAIVEAAGRV